MKINVTVDLEDIYADARGDDAQDFTEAIKGAIRYEVTQNVLKDWRARLGDEFHRKAVEAVESLREGFFSSTMQTLLTNPQVRKSAYSDEMLSLSSYTNEILAREFDSRKIDEKVSKVVRDLGDKMAADLKDRYDTLFAGQLVKKMQENNMLRSDVASLLLGGEGSPAA